MLKDKIWLKMSDEMMMIGAYLTFKMFIIACNLKNNKIENINQTQIFGNCQASLP